MRGLQCQALVFSARCENDDRNFARGAFLISYEVFIVLGNDRPEPCAFLTLGLLRFDGYDACSNLDFRLGIALQIQPPGGMLRGPSGRGDDNILLSVTEEEQRRISLHSTLATGCGEDKQVCSSANLSSRAPIQRDVGLHEKAYQALAYASRLTLLRGLTVG